MPGDRPKKDSLQSSIGKLQSRQRNLQWPQFGSNAREIDKVLLRGSTDTPLVQRIGSILIGTVMMGSGIALVLMGGAALHLLGAIAVTLFGGYIMLNGFRRRGRRAD